MNIYFLRSCSYREQYMYKQATAQICCRCGKCVCVGMGKGVRLVCVRNLMLDYRDRV